VTRDLPAAGARPGTRPVTTQPARKTPNTANRPNDVYTDRNGNVYRKQGDSWQARDKSGWAPADRSARPQNRESLNREHNARQRGNQRTQDYRANRPQQRQSRPAPQPSRSGGRRR
jgi:hypothetical protein